MPRGNGTGPMGMGPMTGRAAGFCSGFPNPGFANQNIGFRCGRGLGPGRGGRGGRGYRNMFYQTGLPGWMRNDIATDSFLPGAADEKEILKRQADHLEKQLEQIRQRLDAADTEK